MRVWPHLLPSILTHLCIGSLYAFNLFHDALGRSRFGKVARVPGEDYSSSATLGTFSCTMAAAGLAAALSGPYTKAWGIRKTVGVAGALFGLGFFAAAEARDVWQLYAAFSLCGIAVGLAYSPPVFAAVEWYPGRKGFAAGTVIMGFGCAALCAAPLIQALLRANFVKPVMLGSIGDVHTWFDSSNMLVAVLDGDQVPVVLLKKADIPKLGLGNDYDIEEGVYVAGPRGGGSSGANETLFYLGLIYGSIMIVSSWFYRSPLPVESEYARVQPTDVLEKSNADDDDGEENLGSSKFSTFPMPRQYFVPFHVATWSTQFALIWMALFLNVTAGIALLGASKMLISDVFGTVMPDVMDAKACAAYVSVLSLFNGAGRLFWASVSDRFGRKPTYSLFFLLGCPLYAIIPFWILLTRWGSIYSALAFFVISTILIVTMYGGGFALAPAYLTDLFGSKDIVPIYGRLLTAWSAAGLVGPMVLSHFRRRSEISFIRQLTALADREAFEKVFGTGVENVSKLIETNSINLSQLITVVPQSVQDPTPFLYDDCLRFMAALLLCGYFVNRAILPVDVSKIMKVNEEGDVEGGK